MTARHPYLQKETPGFISTKINFGLFQLRSRIQDITIVQYGKEGINVLTNMFCVPTIVKDRKIL